MWIPPPVRAPIGGASASDRRRVCARIDRLVAGGQHERRPWPLPPSGPLAVGRSRVRPGALSAGMRRRRPGEPPEHDNAHQTVPPLQQRAPRPSFYWSDFNNVAREVREFCEENGIADERRLPSATELRFMPHPRPWLANGIRRHGGWKRVAEQLGVRTATDVLSQPADASAPKLRRRGGPQKPRHYWRQWKNLRSELTEFVCENFDSARYMPTVDELEEHNRYDLRYAIGLHGGFRMVARQLGLVARSSLIMRWTDLTAVAAEVRRVAERARLPPDVMPNERQLRQYGPRGLVDGIKQHGGLSVVAPRLGLRPQRQYPLRRKPRSFWTRDEADRQLKAFIQECGRVPRVSDFLDAKRNDLLTALYRLGGLRSALERVGAEMDIAAAQR